MALIYLVGDGGPVGFVLSDSVGDFQLKASSPGTYSLRIERIGFESQVSEDFHVPVHGVRGLAVRLALQPIELVGLTVSTSRVCGIDSGAERDLLTVWSEARKALASLVAGRSEDRHFLVELAQSELDRGLRVQSEEVDTVASDEVHGFGFAPPEHLQRYGWGLVENDQVTRFYGPSPEALLSGWFTANHCFALVGDEDLGGNLGIGFESAEDRMRVGMQGVLVIEPESWRLVEIRFRFRGEKGLDRAADQGGEIQVDVDPAFGWYVSAWRMRVPILEVARLSRLSRTDVVSTIRPRYRVAGYVERRGRVIAVGN
jgi:hypothetical protein